MAGMADSFGRTVFTGEQVLGLLDQDGEDGGLNDMFFPGSDEEFGTQEEIGRHDTKQIVIPQLCLCYPSLLCIVLSLKLRKTVIQTQLSKYSQRHSKSLLYMPMMIELIIYISAGGQTPEPESGRYKVCENHATISSSFTQC